MSCLASQDTCTRSDHWDLREDVWSVRKASIPKSISYLSISAFAFVQLRKNTISSSFFLPKPFLIFQALSPTPTATISHHKPSLFSVATPH
ncbi:hypothetical protein GmHk_10G028358 [Glycine max]|nr:hypothetical protein GmHk_10G028358 [Glycine max]